MAVTLPESSKNEISNLLHDVGADIVHEAEWRCLAGDLWFSFFAWKLIEDENSLGRACELVDAPQSTILELAQGELWSLRKIVMAAQKIVESDALLTTLTKLKNYVPARETRGAFEKNLTDAVSELACRISASKTPEETTGALVDFYTSRGSGVFALSRAFRWSHGRGLVPVSDIDPQTLDNLIGYHEQKKELLSNTELFMSGKSANNVLLFGDSGTGKSSSVKALLNEPDMLRRGLRMIELHKDQFKDIPEILDLIRHRNYRFILFMDDLSFEEFEVDYKHLKALIEGGLERKPDNAVIYATSNRRNLIREVWKDRKVSSDDVHGWDTMQEKMSLADRFGISIWYGATDKEQYMTMVESMARENGITLPQEALEQQALRWEIGKGSFTGRTAKQFIRYLLTARSGDLSV